MPPTNLLQRTGIKYPIIQAPMAGTATPAMAAAVSNAGGLGSIGIGAATAAKARAMIRETRQLTDRPFNVNVFVHIDPVPDAARDAAWIEFLRPEFEKFGGKPPATLQTVYQSFASAGDVVAVLLEEKPPVVSFHFGLPPSETIKALKAYGATLFATATNLDEARQIEAAGVDAIVAQGIEAGGHRGMFDPEIPDDELGMFTLTRLLVRSVSIPIIAAGGIMDGQGIRAVLGIGAAAAQLGTAFITCTESDADEGYRKAITGPAAYHTRLVDVVSGRPARSLATRWTEIAAAQHARPAAYPNTYDIGKQINALAKSKGDASYGAFWSGQGAPLVRPMTASELVGVLVKELEAARA
jgi:nitronate monooxygenase